jgi:hypothetical protein
MIKNKIVIAWLGILTISIGIVIFQDFIKQSNKIDKITNTSIPITSTTPITSTPTTPDAIGENDIDISIVIQVAQNIGEEIDVSNPEEVQDLLDKFQSLNYEDKIKYGVWGEQTPEYKVQQLLLQGIDFKTAQLMVDPNGDYWTENKPQEGIENIPSEGD